MKLKKLFGAFVAVGALSTSPLLLDNFAGTSISLALASEDVKQTARKSIKVPAMRDRVYAQLARAQSVNDTKGMQAGLAVLDEVKERLNQLNSYERAMLWNFYGFIYYGGDDVANAISHFEKVVNEQAIPETLYVSTLFSLAQLKTQHQDFTGALTALKRWQQANSKPLKATEHVLFAQIYYQNKNYQETLNSVDVAINLVEAAGQVPKENWLILQRAAFYELKQPINVTNVMEKLVKLYEKPEYWLQLAGMYGEIGEENKQLGTMETAYQAGFITKASDIVSLAQLYLYHDVPFKAASLLEGAIAEGLLVAEMKNLDLVAQAYEQAKESEKAIPALTQATKIAENGKFDERLAQTYLNIEQWDKAILAAEKALERGGVSRAGNMHLVIGMAEFNLFNFSNALQAFNKASKIADTKKIAQQWYKYVEREQSYQERLAMVR